MPIDMPIGCQATIIRETARICFESTITDEQHENQGKNMNTESITTLTKKLETSNTTDSRTKALQISRKEYHSFE
jgi:hypothetical protein